MQVRSKLMKLLTPLLSGNIMTDTILFKEISEHISKESEKNSQAEHLLVKDCVNAFIKLQGEEPSLT
jgi:hypothetical protein